MKPETKDELKKTVIRIDSKVLDVSSKERVTEKKLGSSCFSPLNRTIYLDNSVTEKDNFDSRDSRKIKFSNGT